MRWWVLFLCAGCGRVGFDDAALTGGDAGGDGAPMIDAPDGATGTSRVFNLNSNGSVPTQLLELDIATGRETLLGTIPASFGTLTGLAAWDANTMYASSAGAFVKITLSPFAAVSEVRPGGDFAAIERYGSMLIGLSEGTNQVQTWLPGDMISATTIAMLPAIGQGGDFARTPSGEWYWFTNSSKQLYLLDPAAGTATAVGSPANSAPFMTGLVSDDAGNLFLVGQRFYPVDKTTGQLGTSFPACIVPCASTTNLMSGDTTKL